MKNKLTHIQRMFFDRKAKSNKILFSFVALVLILSLLLTATYSWVETVSTISIQGKGKVDSAIYTNANMDISSSESIDLSKYFKEAGNVHLAPALSHDGVNFQFRKLNRTQDGQLSYRQGNINDKNVNYISFSFKVTAKGSDMVYYFADSPQIAIEDIADPKNLVRFSITVDDVTNIYSNEAVATGTLSINNETKTASLIKDFDDCKISNPDDYLFKVSADETKIVTINMWLDANVAAGAKKVTVDNFKLVPSSDSVNISVGYVTGCESRGSVWVANNASSTAVHRGTSVDLHYSVNSGYKFVGWYDNPDGIGSAVSSPITANENKTYYAKFAEDKCTTTVYFQPRSNYSTFYAYLYSNVNGYVVKYNGDWEKQALSIDSETGLYKFTFEADKNIDFYVLISNGNDQYPAQTGLSGKTGETYLFKAGSPTTLEPATLITFDATSLNWIGNHNAVMYVYDNSAQVNYKMTNSSNEWRTVVPNTSNDISFYRCSPAGFGLNESNNGSAGYWNKWEPAVRNSSVVYKPTDDKGNGSWQ